jgi:hypothetical protein
VDAHEESIPAFAVWRTIGEGLQLYRLLFLRSVTAAAAVYAVLAVVELAQRASPSGAAALFGLVDGVGAIVGPLLLQGALIGLVRCLHEGRPAERLGTALARSRRRFWPLLRATFLYAGGILGGLLLFVVPGVIVAARWSLMVQVVVLEERNATAARIRSSELVKGRTGRMLGYLAVCYLAVLPSLVPVFAPLSFGTATFVSFAIESVVAPLLAYLVAAAYYRLSDPGRPVIHPRVLGWGSVWEGR